VALQGCSVFRCVDGGLRLRCGSWGLVGSVRGVLVLSAGGFGSVWRGGVIGCWGLGRVLGCLSGCWRRLGGGCGWGGGSLGGVCVSGRASQFGGGWAGVCCCGGVGGGLGCDGVVGVEWCRVPFGAECGVVGLRVRPARRCVGVGRPSLGGCGLCGVVVGVRLMVGVTVSGVRGMWSS